METVTLLTWLARIGLVIVIVSGCVWGGFSLLKVRSHSASLTKSLLCALKKRGRPLIPFAVAVSSWLILAPLAGLDNQTSSTVVTAMDVFLIVLAGWAGTIIIHILSDMAQCQYDITQKDNLLARQVHTRVKVLQKILVVLIWLLTMAGILMLFERFKVLGGTLFASAGVISIVLGFSAQKTFGAMIAGLQVALSHPINLDDVVIVEGEWGRIEEITFTYVVVKTWDLRRIVVPMTYFLETPFQNWTKKSADIIGSVYIHADYTVPIAPLREELHQICERSRQFWDGETCLLQVTDAGPETLTLRAIVSSPDASSAWNLRCTIREGLVGFLHANYPDCLPRRRISVNSEYAEPSGQSEEY
jgi:small-conductance mechanosensitive channel